jgi:hypothetical protein
MCCVLCVVHRIRSWRDLYSLIARRGVVYLDLNWRDILIDELVLRYCTGLYRISDLVVADFNFRSRIPKTLKAKILKKTP